MLEVVVQKARMEGYKTKASSFACPMCDFAIPWNLEKVYVAVKAHMHVMLAHSVDAAHVKIKFEDWEN